MHDTLETDDNFEIVASTIKAIYDQTCRSCGLINRLIIYMPTEGKQVRKMRIDHVVGDTAAKQKWLRPDKRQSEALGPVSDKRTRQHALDRSGMTALGGSHPTGPLHPAPAIGRKPGVSGQAPGASGQMPILSVAPVARPIFSYLAASFSAKDGSLCGAAYRDQKSCALLSICAQTCPAVRQASAYCFQQQVPPELP